jgi:hypothetical protein
MQIGSMKGFVIHILAHDRSSALKSHLNSQVNRRTCPYQVDITQSSLKEIQV